ncbi:MAG: hypothetical protein JJU29_05195 [Verrucomicrobia bacterium]|nr:hypothetical protein [Verrucomicrobiota bacterium]MCH8514050.1 hypothetical protein [Kiritimatiellia bacterium]
MRFPNPCFLILLSLALVGCVSVDYDSRATEYQQRLPKTEAETDYKNGDYRIYAAMGVGKYYPGLDADVGTEISAEHGERMIPGTTDAIQNSAHGRFIAAATEFAATYNKRKFDLINP